MLDLAKPWRAYHVVSTDFEATVHAGSVPEGYARSCA